ncbi:MAG: MMPL family transporter [Ruminococcus sp.]|nr:MMPL family transporter [Ruminococcus sp.]
MKKLASFIVEKRVLILIIVLILAGVCGALIPMVGINSDMTKYLPDKSSMKKGMDIMEDEFPNAEEDYTIRVMFRNLTYLGKLKMQEKLSEIKYVDSVDYKSEDKEYNRGEYSKFLIHTQYDYGTSEELSIEKTLKKDFSQDDMQFKNDSTDGPGLPIWVIITAVAILTAILIIMSASWTEPFLFLFTIGIAITVNLGTNIFLGEISEKTLSVAAILQLILSMDYSIILANRYRQELAKGSEKKDAMKDAIVGAFSSISSSSLTTVVGLLAMVFMSFKIGFDMGVVLAKGVFLSVVCVFLILPGLLILFSDLIEKTSKRYLRIPTGGLANACNNLRITLTIFFVALFIGSFVLQRNTNISYYMGGEDTIAEIFPTKSNVVLLYDNQDDDQITVIAERLKTRNNVASAVNYTNTIAKQNNAADMVNAIDDLSQSLEGGKIIDADEKLFNMLYYKYYGGETGKIKAGDFLSFIADDVLQNRSFKKYIGKDMADNGEMIKKLSDSSVLQKPMNATELSEFFEIKQSDCEQLFLYYFVRNEGAETKSMTVGEFVDFVINDLAEDENYSDMFDAATLSQMKLLQNFADKASLQKNYSAKQIAEKLNIKEDEAKLLFVYYYAKQNGYQPKTMTIQELTTFLKNDVASDKNFSSYFKGDAADRIKQLSDFTDRNQIRTQLDADEIAEYLDMNATSVQQLIRMDTSIWDYDISTLSMSDFTSYLSNMMRDSTYGAGFDSATRSRISTLNQIVGSASSGNAMYSSSLAWCLQIDESFVTKILSEYSAQTGRTVKSMPLTDFVDFLVDDILPSSDYSSYFDSETTSNLRMIRRLCDAASSGAVYHSYEFAQMFGMDESQAELVFALYYGTDDRTMSLYEFVDYLQSDALDNPAIAAKVDSSTIEKISMLKNIMDLALSNRGLRYDDAASLFDMDSDTMKLLYTLKESKNSKWVLSLENIISFMSKNKKDLSSMANSEVLSKIDLLKKISDSAIAEEKLDENRLVELTGIKADKAQQLSLLYTYKKGDTDSWKLSTAEFITFLSNDVLSDPGMSDRFESADLQKLQNANIIINAVLSDKEYTSKEMTTLFKGLAEDVDSNSLELLYLYHDANVSPDKEQTMSIEQLMNYLNDTLIYDQSFTALLDDETIEDIQKNAADLKDGVNQLKGRNYSRLILSVTVPEEGEETREFYESINAECSSLKGEYHLIGSSAMNYEMSQTFGKEYFLITILTAVAIFLVVLLTFRSVAVPVILVLMVQCGVYITVTVIGFQGYSIHYLALMIVQCILMGSTIDYGILFSNYYREARKIAGRTEALKMAYKGSINTILTSGLIIVTVTAILGQCYGEPTIEQICQTISIGAASTIIMILIILPGVLACLDRFTAGKDRMKGLIS